MTIIFFFFKYDVSVWESKSCYKCILLTESHTDHVDRHLLFVLSIKFIGTNQKRFFNDERWECWLKIGADLFYMYLEMIKIKCADHSYSRISIQDDIKFTIRYGLICVNLGLLKFFYDVADIVLVYLLNHVVA